jgi:hypothetical protein
VRSFLNPERQMTRRILLLVVVAVATALGACRTEPTGPKARGALSRDIEDPECADTVYMDSMATRASAVGLSASTACHTVIIWY